VTELHTHCPWAGADLLKLKHVRIWIAVDYNLTALQANKNLKVI
jgi:hypothetical protein